MTQPSDRYSANDRLKGQDAASHAIDAPHHPQTAATSSEAPVGVKITRVRTMPQMAENNATAQVYNRPRCETCDVPMWLVLIEHRSGGELHHFECKVCDAKVAIQQRGSGA